MRLWLKRKRPHIILFWWDFGRVDFVDGDDGRPSVFPSRRAARRYARSSFGLRLMDHVIVPQPDPQSGLGKFLASLAKGLESDDGR